MLGRLIQLNKTKLISDQRKEIELNQTSFISLTSLVECPKKRMAEKMALDFLLDIVSMHFRA